MPSSQHVHISRSISKLGDAIPSVNLPPGITCRPDAPCISKCYARKGRWRFSNNIDLLENNLRIWQSDPDTYRKEIGASALFSRYFRWHSAGDIPDEPYLGMMSRIAEMLPYTQFLCFTKKFELVNAYLEEKTLPKNLRLVFSAWGDFLPENPHKLPVAYVRFKNSSQDEIPCYAFECSGHCEDCIPCGNSCWDLEHGQAVVFNEH